MKWKIVMEIISFLFIALFVYTAISKLLDHKAFSVQIDNSPVLTSIKGMGYFVALVVSIGELFIAVLFMLVPYRKIALWSALAILAAFTGYIIVILRFAPYVPCSCGGVLKSLGWYEHLAFNSFFIALAVLGIVINRSAETAGDHGLIT
jgi:hypothetical protein